MHVVIAGCGRVGSQLATLLAGEGHDVVVIDKNEGSFRRLGSNFSGKTLQGNAYDLDDLKEAGIENADVFCALTNLDNTNIMASQVAKKIFKVPEVIGRLYNPERLATYQKLGLSMVCGTILVAQEVKNRVLTSNYDTLEILPTGDIEIVQINAGKNMVGKKLSSFTLQREYVPIAIIRNGVSEIVMPGDIVKQNDAIIFIARSKNIAKLLKSVGLR